MRNVSLIMICLVLILSSHALARTKLQQSIVYSKHNLSAQGPGTIKAKSESEICIFCHTPHNSVADAPLWNRYDSGQVYQIYSSSSSKASVGQPSGASKLCLSCHDGMVAIGSVRSRNQEIAVLGGMGVSQSGVLGTNLAHDHPISFVYDNALAVRNPQLKNPATLTGDVKLDVHGQMQCTSCHDPHHNDYGKFLTVDPQFSNLCVSCHQMEGWEQSSHRLSPATWNGSGANPWRHTSSTSVAQNGCENCHRPHKAGSQQRILNEEQLEANCLVCHNGNVAGKNIANEFRKASVHPIMDAGQSHDPVEEATVRKSRHVQCVDCHNPHASNGQQKDVSGALRMVKGVDDSGLDLKEIRQEYELCLRCHGDSASVQAVINRQSPEHNARLAFAPANLSYHPVMAVGKSNEVPSLISPYTTTSILKCTSCHNNNAGPDNLGQGPNGPHGSDFRPLLERQLVTADNQFESEQSYALCYKCHDRNSILNNRSFSKHKEHIVDQRTPCSACHDSHGVKNAPHLMNFDRNIVQPNSHGILRYDSTGRLSGRCSLKCHNVDHDSLSYGQ